MWTIDYKLWARLLIACSFLLSGLAETLSATGLVVELSPQAQSRFGCGSLVVGGPVQLAGAILLASGRRTRWALGILMGYVFLTSLFGILPGITRPGQSGAALPGLVSNLAVIGGLLHWIQTER